MKNYSILAAALSFAVIISCQKEISENQQIIITPDNKLDSITLYTGNSRSKTSVSGMDIVLTIDYNIQKSIERELDNIVDILNPDNALVVAMNPNTGEILGMGSRPGYDPNNYSKYNMETLSRNLPIWMTYEPGSTFKNVTPLLSHKILYL